MSVRRYWGPTIVVNPGSQFVNVPSSASDFANFSLVVYSMGPKGCEGTPLETVASTGYSGGALVFPATALTALVPGSYIGVIRHAGMGDLHTLTIEIPKVDFGASNVTVI